MHRHWFRTQTTGSSPRTSSTVIPVQLTSQNEACTNPKCQIPRIQMIGVSAIHIYDKVMRHYHQRNCHPTPCFLCYVHEVVQQVLTHTNLHLVWEGDVPVKSVILLRDLDRWIIRDIHRLSTAVTAAIALVISISLRYHRLHAVQPMMGLHHPGLLWKIHVGTQPLRKARSF